MDVEQTPSQTAPAIPDAPALPLIPQITERERRYSVAYVEASIELARDDADAATLAYFRAFPAAVVSEKDARRLSKFLMRRPAVQQLVQHLRRELSMRAMVPVSRVIEELERIGFANIADFGRIDDRGQFNVDLSRASYRGLAAINEVEVKERVIKETVVNKEDVKNNDAEPIVETILFRSTKIKLQKMDALERLAKIHGLYSDGSFDPASALEALDRVINRVKGRIPQQINHQAAP